MKNKYDLRKKTVMVTGGSGFIGSHLAAKLLKNGVGKVKILDKRPIDHRDPLASDKRVEFIKFNLGFDDATHLKNHLNGVEFLFHLAAEKYNQPIRDPHKTMRANIQGSYDLYQAASENDVKKIIFTSSLYAYGRMSKPNYQEKEVPEPSTVYGISKIAGEHLLNFFRSQNGVEFNVLRYLFVYGPKQWNGTGYKSVIVSNFEKILSDIQPTIFGDGKQTLDYIYVDDVVDATIKAMEANCSSQVFNIASGKGTSILMLTNLMLKIAKSKLKKSFLPPDKTAGTYRVGNPHKARKMLGFIAKTPLKDGLKKTLDWMRMNPNER